MNDIVHQINYLLPQTQCQECGFKGCLPYAEAVASGEANFNLCTAGGEAVMLDLANVLNRSPVAPEKVQKKVLAWIDEAVCIGCTACIRACPVDAIMGASKYMHTVLADECTGCGLCVAPCPVDCIYLHDVANEYLPRHDFLADDEQMTLRFRVARHAQTRYERHNARKQRENDARRAKLAEREASAKQQFSHTQAHKPAFNPADLIAQAMAKAQAQQSQRVVPANRADFQKIQLKEAQERATYRRAMRDMQYGTEAEKELALAWLREYKLAQEAKEANNH